MLPVLDSKFCQVIYVQEGDYFDFVCFCTNVLSTANFAKDGNPIDFNLTGKYKKSNILLRVNSLTTEDSGMYTCTAVFGGRRCNYCNKVIVNPNSIPKPLIYSPSPKTRTLREGSSETLLCQANSAVRVLWYKDGEPLKFYVFSGRIRLNRSSQALYFVSVLPEDTGNYSCEAMNRGGATSKHFELIVQGRLPCIICHHSFVKLQWH